MKFLINGMDFNVFASLPKADADFIATLESYDKYPLWDYEDFSKESLEFDAMFDEMVLGMEENGAVTLVKDSMSLAKNTGQLGWSVVKTGAAVGAGAVKGVNYGIKGINTGIRWIQAAVKWIVKMGKKLYESTKNWLSGSMGPMLNDLWASFNKFSERWQRLDTQSREALSLLNTMGTINTPVQIGWHRNFDINALASFYHIVENVESYINAYIWTYFNFKYTNIDELIGQQAQGSVLDQNNGGQPQQQNNNNNNDSGLGDWANSNGNSSIDDYSEYLDFSIGTEADNSPNKESELDGVINKSIFQGKTVWIRPSEISEFSKSIGEYFKNGQNGQGVNAQTMFEFKTRLDAFANAAKRSSYFGDLTFAYCIFLSRNSNNFNLPASNDGLITWIRKSWAAYKSAKTQGTYQMKVNNGDRVDHRVGTNLGLSGAGAYIKTAICGFQDNGNAYVDEFRQGNADIQKLKDVCVPWLQNVTHVTGACTNMTKLLKGNARPITKFTKMLLDGIPEAINSLDRMAQQLNPGSTHVGNQNTTGMVNNNNTNGQPQNNGQPANSSIEDDMDFINYLISVEAETTNNPLYANQDANNENQANKNAGNGIVSSQPDAANAQAQQNQKLKQLQVLFKDILGGVTAYQTVIQGICSSYACYVRGFMSAAFEYIIDSENIIAAIYRASNNEINNQIAVTQLANSEQQNQDNGGNNGN